MIVADIVHESQNIGRTITTCRLYRTSENVRDEQKGPYPARQQPPVVNSFYSLIPYVVTAFLAIISFLASWLVEERRDNTGSTPFDVSTLAHRPSHFDHLPLQHQLWLRRCHLVDITVTTSITHILRRLPKIKTQAQTSSWIFLLRSSLDYGTKVSGAARSNHSFQISKLLYTSMRRYTWSHMAQIQERQDKDGGRLHRFYPCLGMLLVPLLPIGYQCQSFGRRSKEARVSMSFKVHCLVW